MSGRLKTALFAFCFVFFKGFGLVGTFEEDTFRVLKGLILIAMVANFNAEFSCFLIATAS